MAAMHAAAGPIAATLSPFRPVRPYASCWPAAKPGVLALFDALRLARFGAEGTAELIYLVGLIAWVR
jgi:hypothetical protein